MNERLSLGQIRVVCQEMLRSEKRVTGREIRRELRRRFGAAGKTERVFRVWREECVRWERAHAPPPSDVEALAQRLAEAEARATALQARAELAEYREQAHQDRWGLEVDRLRQQLLIQERAADRVRHLEDRVMQLSRELLAARGQ